jgi:hypothetical protein
MPEGGGGHKGRSDGESREVRPGYPLRRVLSNGGEVRAALDSPGDYAFRDRGSQDRRHPAASGSSRGSIVDLPNLLLRRFSVVP